MRKNTIAVPTFARGEYPAMDGTKVKFTDDFMRKLERNTNFLIDAKVLTPPVNYDEIDANGTYKHNGTDAHGQIRRVEFRDGALDFHIEPTGKLRDDVKSGKRIRTSGVFVPNYSYCDRNGKMIEVGPAVVATTMLGNRRPAMRSELIVPLAELNFGEDVSFVDAEILRAQLKKSGLVSQTFSENVYSFSEIEIDPRVFADDDEPKEQPMTPEDKAEFQRMLDDQTAAHKVEMAAQETKFTNSIKQFSEEEKEKKARMDFAESVITEKPTGKLFSEAVRAFAANPSWDNGKSMLLALPAIVTKAKAEGKQGGDDEGDEPKELADLTPKMFSELSKYDSEIAAGMVAYQTKYPKKFAAIKDKPQAERLAALKQHLIEREADA